MWEFQVDTSGEIDIPYDEDEWDENGNWKGDSEEEEVNPDDYYFDEEEYEEKVDETLECDSTVTDDIEERVAEVYMDGCFVKAGIFGFFCTLPDTDDVWKLVADDLGYI